MSTRDCSAKNNDEDDVDGSNDGAFELIRGINNVTNNAPLKDDGSNTCKRNSTSNKLAADHESNEVTTMQQRQAADNASTMSKLTLMQTQKHANIDDNKINAIDDCNAMTVDYDTSLTCKHSSSLSSDSDEFCVALESQAFFNDDDDDDGSLKVKPKSSTSSGNDSLLVANQREQFKAKTKRVGKAIALAATLKGTTTTKSCKENSRRQLPIVRSEPELSAGIFYDLIGCNDENDADNNFNIINNDYYEHNYTTVNSPFKAIDVDDNNESLLVSSSSRQTSFISASNFVVHQSTTPTNTRHHHNANKKITSNKLSSISIANWEAMSAAAINIKRKYSPMQISKHIINYEVESKPISKSMLELDDRIIETSNGNLRKKNAFGRRLKPSFEVYWQNLSFEYKTSWLAQRFKSAPVSAPVLRSITGSFKSNQLVAIIGPSGCGKTTLLSLLAGNSRDYTGTLAVRDLSEPRVSMIGQNDGLLPGLTASETLVFASKLQNSKPNFDHKSHSLSVLRELGILDCANKDVAKLSGGQAKRVEIGKEILYPTNILVLDEVTSGLDASTSFSIIKLLKKLVSDYKYPMSIIMSIHQPSAKLFALFDKVFVMSEGSFIYTGSPLDAIINNELEKFNLKCPRFHNIADYLIEIASTNEDDCVATNNNNSNNNDINNSNGDSSNMCEGNAARLQMIAYQRKLAASEDAQLKLTRDLEVEEIKQTNNDSDFVVFETTKKQQQHQDDIKSNNCAAAANQQTNINIELINNNNNNNNNKQCNNIKRNSNSDSNTCELYGAVSDARALKQRPMFRQTIIHFQRSYLRIVRSYILTYLQVATYVILGLQLSTFYGPAIGSVSGCPREPISFTAFMFGAETQILDANAELRRVQENLNFLLVAVMTATFAALETTVLTFPLEAKTVKREWGNGWYKTSSYFLGRSFADLPFQVIFIVIFSLIIYSLTGQAGLLTWRFVTFTFILMITALIAQTIGFIFGAVFMNNLPAAVFTAPICVFPALLFSGFFSRVAEVPILYKPMTYASHFRYAFDSILITLYGFNRCECTSESLRVYTEHQKNQTNVVRDMLTSIFGYSTNNNDCNSQSSASSPSLLTNNEAYLNSDSYNNNDLSSTVAASSSEIDELPDNPMLLSLLNKTSTFQAAAAATTMTTKMPTSVSSFPPAASAIGNALADDIFENLTNISTTATTTYNNNNNINDYNYNNSTTNLHHLLSNQTTSFGTTPTTVIPTVSENNELGVGTNLVINRFTKGMTTVLNSQSNYGHSVPTSCDNFHPYLINEFNLHDNDLMYDLALLICILILARIICNQILACTIAKR